MSTAEVSDPPPHCETGDVQLVDGGSYYGEVQVCIAGTWGCVCGYGWGSNDANVVCRQLGYESGTACKLVLFSCSLCAPYCIKVIRALIHCA